MTTIQPIDLTALPARQLDKLRSQYGQLKLIIRSLVLDAGGKLDRKVCQQLRPYNDEIDRINAEEARRDEEAFQTRARTRDARLAARPELRNDRH